MKKVFIIGLCSIFIYSNGLSACKIQIDKETNNLCKREVSRFTTIEALSFTPIEKDILQIGGGVCINMDKQNITTKELLYNDKQQTLDFEYPLIYTDENQTIKAQTATVNLDANEANMMAVQYQLTNTNVNGKAKKLTTAKNISTLKNLTYSTCPSDNQQWFVKAASAELDQQKQVGTFKKVTLKIKGVPILYFPYAKLPLTKQRETGFLIPDIRNSSNNGFEIALPYYINISENMDATITPHYFSERGAMLGAELRYLGNNYKGEIFGDYLPSDNISNADRSYIEHQHKQTLTKNWAISSRYNHVSDKEYFEDFGNNVYATSQSYLYSFFNVKGFGQNWQFLAKANEYQVISDSITLKRQPYQSLPSLEYSWFNNSYTSTLNYGLDSQMVNLYREESINAYRLDINPYIEKTYQTSYSKFTPKLSYRQASWDYSNIEYSDILDLEKNTSLPILSLDYKINFDKQFNDSSFSSIEPRLFYLYSPYRNQQNIPIFDTHELTFGQGLLYQTNAFSGVDRQSDANQVSVGVTQRHFDNTGVEKWNVTLGQIAYFDDRKVQLDNSIETGATSPFVSEINYFYQNWKNVPVLKELNLLKNMISASCCILMFWS